MMTKEPTSAEIEAAAQVFYESQTGTVALSTSIYRKKWLRIAREALIAAGEARDD